MENVFPIVMYFLIFGPCWCYVFFFIWEKCRALECWQCGCRCRARRNSSSSSPGTGSNVPRECLLWGGTIWYRFFNFILIDSMLVFEPVPVQSDLQIMVCQSLSVATIITVGVRSFLINSDKPILIPAHQLLYNITLNHSIHSVDPSKVLTFVC